MSVNFSSFLPTSYTGGSSGAGLPYTGGGSTSTQQANPMAAFYGGGGGSNEMIFFMMLQVMQSVLAAVQAMASQVADIKAEVAPDPPAAGEVWDGIKEDFEFDSLDDLEVSDLVDDSELLTALQDFLDDYGDDLNADSRNTLKNLVGGANATIAHDDLLDDLGINSLGGTRNRDTNDNVAALEALREPLPDDAPDDAKSNLEKLEDFLDENKKYLDEDTKAHIESLIDLAKKDSALDARDAIKTEFGITNNGSVSDSTVRADWVAALDTIEKVEQLEDWLADYDLEINDTVEGYYQQIIDQALANLDGGGGH